MKRKLILIASILIFPSMCLGAFDVAQWKYYKDISINSVGSNLIKITLDDEIFSGSNKNLSDVRIVGGGGKETPFKIVSGKQETKTISHSLKMINNSFVSGQYSSVIMDLGEKGKLTNNLKVATTSENFQRNVTVYGSDDMSNWNILRDKAYIYDYTDRKGNFKSQNTGVSFPESAFRYLKLEISDENNSPVKINSVTASQNIDEKNREAERHPQFSSSENALRQSTEIIADLGLQGVPMNRLLLRSDDANFNRGVLIFSSKDKNDWKLLGQGYIFRYNTPKFSGENLQLNFTETNDRYLKIEVLNKDDAPLTFKDVTTYSIYREIIFQGEKNKNYQIFYGNQKANYAEYDLDKYFQYLDVNSAQNRTLSAQKDNVSYVPEIEPVKPLSERIPYLFPTVLGVVSVLLLSLVYRFLKK